MLDDTTNVSVFVFDGIFNGDDMARFAAVDVVDQRGERGRFARTRGASDQNQAARQMREGFHGRRKVQLAKHGHLLRQGANRGGGASALAMQVDPEAAQT